MSLAQGCGARQRARAVRGVTEGRWFDLKAGKDGSRGKKKPGPVLCATTQHSAAAI